MKYFIIFFIMIVHTSCKTSNNAHLASSVESKEYSGKERVALALLKPYIGTQWKRFHITSQEDQKRMQDSQCPDIIKIDVNDSKKLNVDVLTPSDITPGAWISTLSFLFSHFDKKDCQMMTDSFAGIKVCQHTTVQNNKMIATLETQEKVGVYVWKLKAGVSVDTSEITQTLEFVSKTLLKYSRSLKDEPAYSFYCEYTKDPA